jgi:hypothetical protein
LWSTFRDFFLLLIMEGYVCLYQQMDDFVHWRVNMVWLDKGGENLPLSML